MHIWFIKNECPLPQVTVQRSYDVVSTARRYPEGTLVFDMEKNSLYIRVREGIRQIQVKFII